MLRDSIKLLIIISAISFAVMFVIWAIILPIKYFTCNRLEEQAQIETKFDWITGCYVKVNNNWVPEEKWRAMQK